MTGSGKSVLARRLAAARRIPHVELDALFWEPDWTPAPLEEFRRRVSEATARGPWVVDGNYSSVQDITWARAGILVWLDYTLPVILWRLWWRTLRRGVTRQTLWKGNRERLRTQFFSRDSLFLWALKSRKRHKARYPVELRRPQNSHLQVVHLRYPSEARRWLGGLDAI